MRFLIPMRPFPAIRVNRRGNFTEEAKNYHEKMNIFRALCGNKKELFIKGFLNGNISIDYFFKIPEGKKNKIKEGDYYLIAPDIDNLFKAVTDSLFYGTKYNDKAIFRMPPQEKIRGDRDCIIIEILE